MYDLIVIGSGPAGLSAAIYGVRAGLKLLVLEQNPMSGGQILNTYEVDNYLGLPGLTGAELLTAFRRHAEAAGVQFLTGKVLAALRMGDVWNVSVGSEMESARAVVLAAGVTRGRKFPGETELLG
ncbi:MAG: NAD(P)/FAD-dependent oxidoreductase, partial [Acetatifactor sp.]|nr:NAD(P)/FAD-dependent oxidoreductase [Acetatifactor sp.]